MRTVAFATLSILGGLSCNSAPHGAVSNAGADHPFIEHVLSSEISWRTVTTPHFHVHGVVDSYAEAQLTSLAAYAGCPRARALRERRELAGG